MSKRRPPGLMIQTPDIQKTPYSLYVLGTRVARAARRMLTAPGNDVMPCARDGPCVGA